MRRSLPLCILVTLFASACEKPLQQLPTMTSPNAAALFSAAPEKGFQLSASDRAKIPPIINADALERLLAWLRPEHRAEVLQFHQELGKGGKVTLGHTFATTGNPEIDRIAKDIVVVPERLPNRPE
jgi:hypothetical protein